MRLFPNIFSKLNKKTAKNPHYALKDTKTLTINSVPQDLSIKVIHNLKDKVTSLIQPKNITMKDGYLLRKVHAFNSFGMFYHVDVIFCNKNFQVIKEIENFGPQKISHYFKDSYFIYCLAPGMIKFLNIKENDILRII
ncbi:hypothetical protein [Spiroplasma chrysopicola]|nr:hypothetical protein [Spiroplasma chrysopicola]